MRGIRQRYGKGKNKRAGREVKGEKRRLEVEVEVELAGDERSEWNEAIREALYWTPSARPNHNKPTEPMIDIL